VKNREKSMKTRETSLNEMRLHARKMSLTRTGTMIEGTGAEAGTEGGDETGVAANDATDAEVAQEEIGPKVAVETVTTNREVAEARGEETRREATEVEEDLQMTGTTDSVAIVRLRDLAEAAVVAGKVIRELTDSTTKKTTIAQGLRMRGRRRTGRQSGRSQRATRRTWCRRTMTWTCATTARAAPLAPSSSQRQPAGVTLSHSTNHRLQCNLRLIT
jgi:hypothetical protein